MAKVTFELWRAMTKPKAWVIVSSPLGEAFHVGRTVDMVLGRMEIDSKAMWRGSFKFMQGKRRQV